MSFCAPPRAKSRQFHSPESSDPLNARPLRSLGFPKSPPLKNPRSANDWQHAQPQNLRVLGEENRIPVLLSYYWYCPRSMHVYVTVPCPSVRPSVPFARCSSVLRVCCCGPGGREISIDCCTAGAAEARGRSSKCGQCHVYCSRTKLNTDWFKLFESS